MTATGLAEGLGRSAARRVEEIGFGGALFAESLYWILFGASKRQPVRLSAVVLQMTQIGLQALPIATVLAATIGMMLALLRREDLELLAELMADGRLSSRIDRRYSLDETPEALRYLETQRARGKVIIAMTPSSD